MNTTHNYCSHNNIHTIGKNTATRFVVSAAYFLFIGLMPFHTHSQPVQEQLWPQPVVREEPVSNTPSPQAIEREQTVQKLFNKALAAENKKDTETALSTYEQIVQFYKKEDLPTVQELAANALLNRGVIFNSQGNTQEAISTYERLDRRFGQESTTPEIRKALVSALVFKAEALYAQGNTKKSLATYQEIEKRFRKDEDSLIKQLIDITRWRAAEMQMLEDSKTKFSSQP